MFRPNLVVKVQQVIDVTAQGINIYGNAWDARASIVRIQPLAQKTSVRADSSASRGAADEIIAKSVMLFAKTREPKIDEVVETRNFRLRIIGVEPRFAVNGKLDHYQVVLEHFGEASA